MLIHSAFFDRSRHLVPPQEMPRMHGLVPSLVSVLVSRLGLVYAENLIAGLLRAGPLRTYSLN